MSQRNLKHISKHLSDFQQYDPNLSLDDIVKLGLEIASRRENLIATPGGRQVFEQNVMIGNQQVIVRAVLNQIGNLRSVHIKNE
ncbi:hypothetical protein [Aerosakkonema funiforme]|uniref:hypothetical protein n=1 Tax=Aerosakkonema funiforme TaxID=1246630 RepID=UPI0035B8E4D0